MGLTTSGRACCWRDVGLLVLSWLSVSKAADVALDELVLIQKDSLTQLDAKMDVNKTMEFPDTMEKPGVSEDYYGKGDERITPSTMLASQRRKTAITMVKAEFEKLMSEQDLSQSLDGQPDSLKVVDPATIMDMLPSLMDALRDDNFIRSFIEFEDGIETASKHVVQYAHDHLTNFLLTTNSSEAVLSRSGSKAALRMRVAEFLDYWLHKVLASYPVELATFAGVFSQQVGGDHQLSKGFADLFIPLFHNMSELIATRMVPGAPDNCSNPMSFVAVLGNGSDAYFCQQVGAIIYNASKTDTDALKALKVLNMTRRSAVPMLGKFLTDTLPLDASEEDKQVPERMMLVVDYEVSAISAGVDVLRRIMGEYAAGLAPMIKDMHCQIDAAMRLSALPGLTVLLLLALVVHSEH